VQVKERNEKPQPHMNYSAVHSFLSVEKLAELADGLLSGEGWVFICSGLQRDKFNCTVLTVAERRARPNVTLPALVTRSEVTV